ncbi:hypothetical protein RD792_001567 [Penstemon davidsonii]|uniref:Apple domain-containing protein n=1 Tax=Penstemon davidsonii TaxID=160366 RepID=A0ABR0DP09_9LAMI|nr:hypothetical protein RD792_001567 [Penstemon davidsonii]
MSTLPDSTEAVLLDNGNFVLGDRSRPRVIFWQSFDYPTDTWLPESSLGFNKINGRTQHLVAWKNTEDPSPGMYSIEISQDETNEVSLLWNMSTRYLKSGAWNEIVFGSLPKLSYFLDFSFVSNKNEIYYTYSLLNYAVFSRLVITPSGRLEQLTSLRNHSHRTWTETYVQPKNGTDIFGFCGAFGIYTDSPSNPCTCLQGFASVSTRPNDWSSGCSRKALLQCGDSNSNKGKDGFLKTSKVKLPANPKVHPASNARQCKSACLQDCSCTAYTLSESGCLIWDGNLLNLQNDSSSEQSLYLKVANSELRDAKGKKKIMEVIVAVVVPVVVSGGLLGCFYKRRNKHKVNKDSGEDLLSFDFNYSGNAINDGTSMIRNRNMKDFDLPMFSYASVSAATNNFSQNNKIGEGGFGPVYKVNFCTYLQLICGYMAPEYAMQGLFSIKSDVFSFGVLVLEIISGKKNTGFYNTDCLSLLGHAWELWISNRGVELLDPAVGSTPVGAVLRYINVGLLTYSSVAAEKFTTHLQENQFNVEKSLNTVKANLDSPSITQVLKRAENVLVSVKMFKVVLNLCRAAKDANLGLWVLRKMKEFNCRPDTVSYNVVIRLFLDKGELDEAIGLMREMGLIDLYPDMVTYVSVLKGLCDVGRLEDAFGLIKVMKGHNCVPNAVIYSTLLDGICRYGTLERGMEFLGELERENEQSKPNLVTYTIMIKGFVKKGRAIEAMRVLDQMSDSNIKPNRVTIVALLDGLCKEGCVEEACKVIDKVSGGNICYEELYSLLVVSLLRSGKHKESEEMFRMMVARGMRPSGLASSGVIKRMISEGRALEGFRLFDTLEKLGNLPVLDSDIYSTLLNGLCEENCFVEAAKLIDRMVEGKILLKSPYGENIIKRLKVSGVYDLASNVARINSWSLNAHNMS